MKMQISVHKFIVDPVGRLPVMLMELDPCSTPGIEKSYVYAHAQVLYQLSDYYDGDPCKPYADLHDRLGSVRLLAEFVEQGANEDITVTNQYTYDPFGNRVCKLNSVVACHCALKAIESIQYVAVSPSVKEMRRL